MRWGTTGLRRPFLPVSMISPLGLPKCEQRMTFAPLSRRNLAVGTMARRRVSSVTVTSSYSCGKKEQKKEIEEDRFSEITC